MFSKTVFKSVILAICLISLYGVFGMPDLNTMEDNSLDNSTFHRNKRQVNTNVAGTVEFAGAISDAFTNKIAACTESGCECGHNNKCYCWARCSGVLGGRKPKEWCWTTKGSSQDRNYVECSGPGDCDGCWKCAASCSL